MDQKKSPLTTLPPCAIERYRKFILVSYYGLFAYFLVNSYMYFDKLSLITIVVWLIQIVPLLIFVVGLHKIKIRTYGWLCFVCLMYFTHGVLVAFDPGQASFGISGSGPMQQYVLLFDSIYQAVQRFLSSKYLSGDRIVYACLLILLPTHAFLY